MLSPARADKTGSCRGNFREQTFNIRRSTIDLAQKSLQRGDLMKRVRINRKLQENSFYITYSSTATCAEYILDKTLWT